MSGQDVANQCKGGSEMAMFRQLSPCGFYGSLVRALDSNRALVSFPIDANVCLFDCGGKLAPIIDVKMLNDSSPFRFVDV